MTKALSPEVQQMMQLSIEYGYKRLSHQADARKAYAGAVPMCTAQGRLTGEDAKANGLVDSPATLTTPSPKRGAGETRNSGILITIRRTDGP